MVYSLILVYPTSSQCLSTPLSLPSGTTAAGGVWDGADPPDAVSEKMMLHLGQLTWLWHVPGCHWAW